MITAVVLSHNDEQIIQKTLQRLSWCDEIILLDDYSTDKTPEIAKKLGVTIIQRHVDGDFAGQRNAGLSEAKGEWVLYVDSDEIVTKELAHEINEKVMDSRTSGNDKVVGYYLKRQDFIFGQALKHGETEGVRLLRLAKKEAGVWRRPVHEVWEVSGLTGQLSYPLLHYPHPNVAQFLDTINTYSTLNARYLYSQHIHASAWHIVAYPALKFFVNYVWLLGFLDGTAGIIVAIMMSFHSFLTRAKLYLLWHKNHPPGQNI